MASLNFPIIIFDFKILSKIWARISSYGSVTEILVLKILVPGLMFSLKLLFPRTENFGPETSSPLHACMD